MLTHPAFGGFARLLLPWDNRTYEPTLSIRNVGTLLPYHSHVDPSVVVASLNRLIDHLSAGRTVFYDIYTDAQKRAESSRNDTGLFFVRGTPGAPFAVIAPGGGFAYVGSLHEGSPYAVGISTRGYNSPAVMEKRVAGLRRLGTEVLYRKYPGVGHGFGLGVGTTAAGWITDAVGFWAKQIVHAAHPDKAAAPVGGPR